MNRRDRERRRQPPAPFPDTDEVQELLMRVLAISDPELLTLKAHLLVETALTQLLCVRLHVDRPELPRLGFEQKARLALSGLESFSTRSPLKFVLTLNNIRNAYAHEFVPGDQTKRMQEIATAPQKLESLGLILPERPRELPAAYRIGLAFGSLRHRADVRRAMLEDLTDHVGRDVVEAIDKAAVTFYEKRPDRISRAEEIYHRLRLQEDTAVLESRWIPDAAIRLKGAGDELPAELRLWLAEKLGVTLDEAVRTTANQHAWERQAARAADRFLASREGQRALEVLHERADRLPRSTLYALEAEAYRLVGKYDEALRVARAGVESASAAGAIDMALDLLLKMVVIEEARGRLDAADRLLTEASAVADSTSNEILWLRVLITRLRVQRQLRPEAREERANLRTAARGILTPDVLRKLRRFPVLLREVAAELAKDDSQLAAVAIETLGLEVASDAQARKLGQAVATLAGSKELEYVFDPEVMAAVKRIQLADFDPEVVRKWVTEEVSRKDARMVGSRLASSAAGEKVLREFREYFRAGVANTLRAGLGDFDI